MRGPVPHVTILDEVPFSNNETTTWNPSFTKRDRYLTMAAGVALDSKCKFRHGAIVVKHGKILGSSYNIYKNDPKYVDFRHSQIHAEVAALKKAGWPTRATVYVARVNAKGYFRMSKPCENCQILLDRLKCKVVWTENAE